MGQGRVETRDSCYDGCHLSKSSKVKVFIVAGFSGKSFENEGRNGVQTIFKVSQDAIFNEVRHKFRKGEQTERQRSSYGSLKRS